MKWVREIRVSGQFFDRLEEYLAADERFMVRRGGSPELVEVLDLLTPEGKGLRFVRDEALPAPTPRCATCKHWEQRDAQQEREDRGFCAAIGESFEATFGCVHHESRQ